VRCCPVPGLPPCTRAVAAPAQRQGSGSYEALGLQAGQAEGSLLQQAGVVCEGQPLVCWVGGQPLELDVLEVVPPPAGRLVPGTEVVVLPGCAPVDSVVPTPPSAPAALPGPVAFQLRLLSAERASPAWSRRHRVCAGEGVLLSNPFATGVHPSILQELQLPREGGLVELFPRRVRAMTKSKSESHPDVPPEEGPAGVAVWAYAVEDLPEGHVLASDGVLRALRLPHLGCVDCRPRITPSNPAPQGLELRITQRGSSGPRGGGGTASLEAWSMMMSEDAQNVLPEFLRLLGNEETSKVAEPLLYNGADFDLTLEDREHETISVSVVFKGVDNSSKGSDEEQVTCVAPEQALAVPVSISWRRPIVLEGGAAAAEDALPTVFPRVQEDIVSGLSTVVHALHCNTLKERGWDVCHASAGFLVVGPSGSGKSTLLRGVARDFERVQNLPGRAPVRIVYVEMVNLKRPAAARKAVASACAECIECQPAILVLDDIDAALGGTTETDSGAGGANGPTASQKALVAALEDLLLCLLQGANAQGERPPIGIVASARSTSAVPPSLKASGLLCNAVELPPLESSTRMEALVSAATMQGLSMPLDLAEEFAGRMEGYGLLDLNAVMSRARLAHITAALKRGSEDEAGCNDLSRQSLENALEDFVPANARGATTGPARSVESLPAGWGAVGGMSAAVRALKEALELPGKHADVFSNAPLRLRSGCLLYGPSGCGKTYLAGVAARACGLRFISVKGPELLNKYIGQSEAGVRQAFQRANSAAPCVLFFDEFDALAPRRGNDNTGVTDRVVNQLLAELDGVEKLQGVFVVAASSRPDLLDPALLRPGRLDRLVHCGFPSFRERLEILEVLRHGVRLSDSASLEGVARLTEGFSGADLRALITDAQLHAAKRTLRKPSAIAPAPVTAPGEAAVAAGSAAVEVGREDLDLTVATAKPSFAPRERARLEALYAQFKSSGQPNAASEEGKRSTLA